MDKRKTVFTTVVIGAGIMAIIDRIKLHNKVEELEEKIEDIGRCHNDFYLTRINRKSYFLVLCQETVQIKCNKFSMF